MDSRPDLPTLDHTATALEHGRLYAAAALSGSANLGNPSLSPLAGSDVGPHSRLTLGSAGVPGGDLQRSGQSGLPVPLAGNIAGRYLPTSLRMHSPASSYGYLHQFPLGPGTPSPAGASDPYNTLMTGVPHFAWPPPPTPSSAAEGYGQRYTGLPGGVYTPCYPYPPHLGGDTLSLYHPPDSHSLLGHHHPTLHRIHDLHKEALLQGSTHGFSIPNLVTTTTNSIITSVPSSMTTDHGTPRSSSLERPAALKGQDTSKKPPESKDGKDLRSDINIKSERLDKEPKDRHVSPKKEKPVSGSPKDKNKSKKDSRKEHQDSSRDKRKLSGGESSKNKKGGISPQKEGEPSKNVQSHCVSQTKSNSAHSVVQVSPKSKETNKKGSPEKAPRTKGSKQGKKEGGKSSHENKVPKKKKVPTATLR